MAQSTKIPEPEPERDGSRPRHVAVACQLASEVNTELHTVAFIYQANTREKQAAVVRQIVPRLSRKPPGVAERGSAEKTEFFPPT